MTRGLEVVSQAADGHHTNALQTPAVFKPTKTSFEITQTAVEVIYLHRK